MCSPPTLCTAAALHHNAHIQSLSPTPISLAHTYPCHLLPKAGNMVIFHGNIFHSMLLKCMCCFAGQRVYLHVSVGVDVLKGSYLLPNMCGWCLECECACNRQGGGMQLQTEGSLYSSPTIFVKDPEKHGRLNICQWHFVIFLLLHVQKHSKHTHAR